jgi:hypothetical protein
MDLNQLTRIINDKNFTQKTFLPTILVAGSMLLKSIFYRNIIKHELFSLSSKGDHCDQGRKVRDFNHS